MSCDTYVSFKLEENLVVVVVAEDGVGCQPLEEDFVHGHRLLEGGQVLPAGGQMITDTSQPARVDRDLETTRRLTLPAHASFWCTPPSSCCLLLQTV